jgi:hypothetical protein
MQTLLNGEMIVNLDARNQAWKRKRERGQVAYVLRDMLIAGGSVCAYRVLNAHYHHLPLGKTFLDCIVPTLEGLFTGFIAGIWEWNSGESRYEKALAQESPTNEILTNKS